MNKMKSTHLLSIVLSYAIVFSVGCRNRVQGASQVKDVKKSTSNSEIIEQRNIVFATVLKAFDNHPLKEELEFFTNRDGETQVIQDIRNYPLESYERIHIGLGDYSPTLLTFDSGFMSSKQILEFKIVEVLRSDLRNKVDGINVRIDLSKDKVSGNQQDHSLDLDTFANRVKLVNQRVKSFFHRYIDRSIEAALQKNSEDAEKLRRTIELTSKPKISAWMFTLIGVAALLIPLAYKMIVNPAARGLANARVIALVIEAGLVLLFFTGIILIGVSMSAEHIINDINYDAKMEFEEVDQEVRRLMRMSDKAAGR